jgi:hypothetical protein
LPAVDVDGHRDRPPTRDYTEVGGSDSPKRIGVVGGQEMRNPSPKAGVVRGCSVWSQLLRKKQIEPDNKHTLLQWASVAQVTKVIRREIGCQRVAPKFTYFCPPFTRDSPLPSCINSEAVSKAPSARPRAGELPVVSNLGYEVSGQGLGQDSPASLAQKASVTSAPASRTGTMERGSPAPVIASGGKVGRSGGAVLHLYRYDFMANDLVPDNRHHPRTKHPHREYLRLVASAPLERRAGLSRDRTMPPGTGLGT